VASSGMMFIPNFMKIRQFVPMLRGVRNTWTRWYHADNRKRLQFTLVQIATALNSSGMK